MPLTAVGKLFKPELVCREIKQIIDQRLAPAFAQDQIQIKMEPDKKSGIIAKITVTAGSNGQDDKVAIKAKIKTLLSDYSFHYQVCVTKQTTRELQ